MYISIWKGCNTHIPYIYVKSCKIFSYLYYLRNAFSENLEESNDKKWQNEYMKYDTDNSVVLTPSVM